MYLNQFPDDRRRVQRDRVRVQINRTIEQLQNDGIADYLILRSLVSIARKLHRRTEAEALERAHGRAAS